MLITPPDIAISIILFFFAFNGFRHGFIEEIGKIISFKGIHAENYMPENAPHTFRTDHTGGGGALMDLGSHIISIARYLLGPIEEVVGLEETLINKRMRSKISLAKRLKGVWKQNGR